MRVNMALGHLVASLEFDVKKYGLDESSYTVKCLREAKEIKEKMSTMLPIEE